MSRPGIVKSSQWMLLGKVLATLMQMGVNVFLARRLGPAGFGALGLANTVALTMTGIVGFGLNQAGYKYIAEYQARDAAMSASYLGLIWWTQGILATVILLGMWFTRILWSDWVFPSGATQTLIALTLLLAWVSVFTAFFGATLSGFHLFREVNLLALLQQAAVIAAAALLVRLEASWTLLAYTAGALVFALAGGGLQWRANHRAFQWPARTDWRRLPRVFNFSAPFVGAFFIVGPLTTAASVYLAQTPDGATQLGLFNTANTLRNLIAFLPLSVMPVIGTAILQEGGALGDETEYQRLVLDAFMALGLLALVMLLGAVFCGDLLLKIYGNDYAQSFALFAPIGVATALSCLSAPVNYVLLAKDKVWWSLLLMVVKAALLLGLTRATARAYGAASMAWATLAAELVFCVLNVEAGIWLRGLLPGARRVVYGLCLAFGGLLALALGLPAAWRWALVAPLALACVAGMIRWHPPLAEQLANLAPALLRPWVRRSTRLVAPASREIRFFSFW
jgi:O-antigen/teichoic acid export membrane protein